MVARKKGKATSLTQEYYVPFLYIEMKFGDANFHLDRKEHIL